MLRLNRAVPADIQRGAIVLTARPGECLSIKRVIGLPNETIAFDRGEVFVNGRMLYEPYLLQCVLTFSWDRQSLATKKDEYVLLGDNRLTSEDSRQCGVIPRSQIIAISELDCAAPELLDQPHYRITRREDPPVERFQSRSHESARNHDTTL
jgi:signal peptidase I